MKIGQNTRGGSNVGLRFNGAHMLGNTPEFAAHLQDMGIQDVAVIEAAFMIEDEPAANLRQFGCRKVIQHSLGNQLDKKDTGGVEDTAQQAPFQRQSIALIDIVKCAQGEDRAFEFGCASAAEWIRANLLAPLLQCGNGCGGRHAFLLASLLTFLSAQFQFLQANQFALLPQYIALVFAQTGGTDAAQVFDIAGPPQVQHRVIANDKRTRDRQQFACDALE